MVDFVKQNPLVAVATVFSAIGVIVGSVLAIDSRYAHAGELERDRQTTAELVRSQTLVIKQETLKLRQQSLEDKVFELDVRRESAQSQRLSPVEQAQYNRYARQLDEINKAMNVNR